MNEKSLSQIPPQIKEKLKKTKILLKSIPVTPNSGVTKIQTARKKLKSLTKEILFLEHYLENQINENNIGNYNLIMSTKILRDLKENKKEYGEIKERLDEFEKNINEILELIPEKITSEEEEFWK